VSAPSDGSRGEPAGPILKTTSKDRLLPLLGQEDAPAPVASMREALLASPETSLRLAQGRTEALARTYGARLREAQAHGVPTVGIQALLDALEGHPQDHVWGFTVRDRTMIYVGFADAELGRLLGVVIFARAGAEQVMAT
jgi:hypothetical protein